MKNESVIVPESTYNFDVLNGKLLLNRFAQHAQDAKSRALWQDAFDYAVSAR